MKFYLLRDIPDDLWIRVKRRAAKEGRSIRWIVLKLLETYAAHGINGHSSKEKR